jgi:hypothetical protein
MPCCAALCEVLIWDGELERWRKGIVSVQRGGSLDVLVAHASPA